jgi:hypothetical protein
MKKNIYNRIIGAKFYAIIWAVCFLIFKSVSAQTNCQEIPVIATFQLQKVLLNDTVYKLNNSHHVKFEVFKFYVSNVKLLNNKLPVWIEDDSFHLIDFEESDSNLLCIDIPEDLDFNSIQFNLGIDSLTSVSGAFGGDLDPTKGMYWTWNSGYINFKLEGTSDLCNNPKNEFQFHLGGYVSPFNCLQEVHLEISNSSKFSIAFDLEHLIKQIDLQNLNHVMSPNAAGVELSLLAAKCFSIR